MCLKPDFSEAESSLDNRPDLVESVSKVKQTGTEQKDQTPVPQSCVVALTHVRTSEEVTGVKSQDPGNWTVPIENSEHLEWNGVNTSTKCGRKQKEDTVKSSATKKILQSSSQSSGGQVWLQAAQFVSEPAGKNDLPVKGHSDALRPSSLSPISSAVVSQQEIAQQSNDAEVNSNFAPKVTDKLPASVDLVEGDMLNLKVKICGKPVPEIKWVKDGKPLKPSSRIQTPLAPDGTAKLKITDMTRDDAGSYKVIATNDKGQAASESDVSVAFLTKNTKPFVEQLHDLDTVLGKPIILEVEVTGNPQPKIQWFKDGNPLVSGNHIKLLEGEQKAFLNIEDAKVEDAGEYKLFATNDQGVDSSSAVVKVSVPGKKPTIVEELKAGKMIEGEEGKLQVVVSGQPMPTVAWMHNGKNVMENQRFIPSIDENGLATLAIQDVKREDEGMYTAIATNKLGKAISEASVIVVLVIKETEEEKKPSKVFEFLQSLMPQLVEEGKSCQLEAKVTSDPKPILVKWTKDGKEIPPSERIQSGQDSTGCLKLCISHMTPADSGKYAVIVSDRSTEIKSEAVINSISWELKHPSNELSYSGKMSQVDSDMKTELEFELNQKRTEFSENTGIKDNFKDTSVNHFVSENIKTPQSSIADKVIIKEKSDRIPCENYSTLTYPVNQEKEPITIYSNENVLPQKSLKSVKRQLAKASKCENVRWKIKSLSEDSIVFRLQWGVWLYECTVWATIVQMSSNESMISFTLSEDSDEIEHFGYKCFKYFVTDSILPFSVCSENLVSKLMEYSDVINKVETLMLDVTQLTASYEHEISESLEPLTITVKGLNRTQRSKFSMTFSVDLSRYPTEKIVPVVQHLMFEDITEHINETLRRVEPRWNFYMWTLFRTALHLEKPQN